MPLPLNLPAGQAHSSLPGRCFRGHSGSDGCSRLRSCADLVLTRSLGVLLVVGGAPLDARALPVPREIAGGSKNPTTKTIRCGSGSGQGVTEGINNSQ